MGFSMTEIISFSMVEIAGLNFTHALFAYFVSTVLREHSSAVEATHLILESGKPT